MPLSTDRPKRANAARTYEDEGSASTKVVPPDVSPPVTAKPAAKRLKSIAPADKSPPAETAKPPADKSPKLPAEVAKPSAGSTPPLLKLLSIQRTVSVERAQDEIKSKEEAKVAADAALKEAQRVLRATRKITKDGRKKVLKDAEAAVETSKAAVPVAERALAAAQRDAVPDDARILRRLEEELRKDQGSYGFSQKASMGSAVVHDLCTLHAASLIGEQPMDRAIEMMTAAASAAPIAATAVMRLAGAYGWEVPPAATAVAQRALRALCEWFVPERPNGACDSPSTPLISIAKAMSMADLGDLRQPAFVDRFVARVHERAAAMQADAAAPRPVQSGVVAGLQALLARTKPAVDELAELKRQCPWLGLMLPILKRLAGGDLNTGDALSSAAGKIRSALTEGLQSALRTVIPDQPDYSMPEPAAIIGKQCDGLSAFLASSTERTWSFNAGSTGRMRMHHLIQDALEGRFGLRHESEGCGSDRQLVVTKINVATPEQLELQRRLQKLHREALSELP